jgi:hypothetical protein
VPTVAPTGPTEELEMFSWWTEAGEAEGLAAMLEVFQTQYPEGGIINATVAGGQAWTPGLCWPPACREAIRQGRTRCMRATS